MSTDGRATWTSPANANLPGLTGWSGDWVNMSCDLSAYAGQPILVAFRYLTGYADYTYDFTFTNKGPKK